MIEQEPEFICSICGKLFKGAGNNSWPVKPGKCCDKCYSDKVMPERQIQIMGMAKGEKSGRRN